MLFPGEIKLCSGGVPVYSFKGFLFAYIGLTCGQLVFEKGLKLMDICIREMVWNPGTPWCQREFVHCFQWARNSKLDFIQTCFHDAFSFILGGFINVSYSYMQSVWEKNWRHLQMKNTSKIYRVSREFWEMKDLIPMDYGREFCNLGRPLFYHC